MPVIHVDDVDDPRLAELAGLTDAEARRRRESRWGCFVAEGLLSLSALAASAHPLRAVLAEDRKLERVLGVLGPRAGTTPVYVGNRALLTAVTGFPIHRGVVASGARLPLPDTDELLSRLAGPATVLVVEGVNDHENIGALFRNAAAFGVDAVLLDPTSADPLYRRSVRVSLGHVLHVPWTCTDALPGGLAPLRDHGFTTLGLTPAAPEPVDATIGALDAAGGDGRLAWIVGAEGHGLRAATLAACDRRTGIPLAAGVDSLNVATAAAVALALSRQAREP